ARSTSAVYGADAISECARANRNAMPSCSQLDTVKIRSRKNTVTQKYREWRPKNPAGKNSRASFRQRATMKVSNPESRKPGCAGLSHEIIFVQFISPAWRSGERGVKPFGSHCSCE